MKRVAFRGDEVAIPRHQQDDGPSLRCNANGCPNRWSVDMGNGRLCSWHDRAAKHQWPQITQEAIEAETDRARAQPLAPPDAVLTRAEKIALLERLRRLVSGPDNRHEWAHRLRSRRARGERLSPAQRHCLAEFEQRHGGV
jgi:hypothetical protein